MASEQKDSGVSFNSFFSRCKLPLSTRDECDEFVTSRYPDPIRPAPFQGYCSYTIFVGDDKIVQFRAPEHSIDIDIVATACEIYGSLTPATEFMGVLGDSRLHIYLMRRLAGVSLSDFRASSVCSDVNQQRCQIVRDFARLQAIGVKHAKENEEISAKRTVGSSLQWRLNLMKSNIPPRFQGLVSLVQRELPNIEKLPWVLSHGDFLPANVLVCDKTGQISGLLDWAEAEWLPFGIGMYGLEELLGEVRNGRFEYYPEARQLRRLFWSELVFIISEPRLDAEKLRTVKAAQIFGVLLWHSIAFDNGKLDRVVEEGIDDAEIQRLDAFLSGSSGTESGKAWLSLSFVRRCLCNCMKTHV